MKENGNEPKLPERFNGSFDDGVPIRDSSYSYEFRAVYENGLDPNLSSWRQRNCWWSYRRRLTVVGRWSARGWELMHNRRNLRGRFLRRSGWMLVGFCAASGDSFNLSVFHKLFSSFCVGDCWCVLVRILWALFFMRRDWCDPDLCVQVCCVDDACCLIVRAGWCTSKLKYDAKLLLKKNKTNIIVVSSVSFKV